MAKEEIVEPAALPMTALSLSDPSGGSEERPELPPDDGSEDGSDDEIDLVQNEPRKPRNKNRPMSKKKQADYAAFDSWLVNHKAATARSDSTKAKNAADRSDESKSAAWLMQEFENSKIIESPRDYQIELFERAKERNTIAVLDTGSGKTLIAALLLRHVLAEELSNRAKGQPKKVAFFLVDKIALVFQQHAVLECNLDQPIAKFCGDMLDRRSNAEYWTDVLDKHMIVVCTAAILLKCLYHSFITMDQINLLIFDEAHHAKKNHPFAEIIKQFYVTMKSKADRPRIFGMTASPVDSKTDVRKAAEELEGLLHSEIATIRDATSLKQTICKPKTEQLERYNRPANPCPSPLSIRIHQLVGTRKYFKRHFTFEKHVATEIGTWAVDRFWQLVFAEKEMGRLEAEAQRECASSQSYGDHELMLEGVREAGQAVREYAFMPPGPDNIVEKTRVLLHVLRRAYLSLGGEKTRCIVFVEQRWTAMMLTDLLQSPEVKILTLEPATLVGGGETSDVERTSFRSQLLTLTKFRRGEINCLFATSVAEEGLDIPECNLIIRFDLYRTMIQYVQSRGRARHEDSTYVHMLEVGNPDHNRRLMQLRQDELMLRMFCDTLPEDRRLVGNDWDMERWLQQEQKQKEHIVRETKAKLTYRSSLVVLAEFVASLPCPPTVQLVASYLVTRDSTGGGYICEVKLPDSAPIQRAMGEVQRSKALAKCSAAFEMCVLLRKRKFLDVNLKSTFTKQLPAMRNALLALSSKHSNEYSMKIKPENWSQLGHFDKLYATVLHMADPEAMKLTSIPLMLLTRNPLPNNIPSVRLFFNKERASDVNYSTLEAPLEFKTEDEKARIALFTAKIFDDVFSKTFEGGPNDWPYFVVPTTISHGDSNMSGYKPRDILDWASLPTIGEPRHAKFTMDQVADPEALIGKFVIDFFGGSRKFILRGVRRDMSPTDMVPEGVPSANYRAWRLNMVKHDILNYSNSMWKKSREQRVFDATQPVFQAELLSARRNLLDDRFDEDEDDFEAGTCYIILEPFNISSLSLKTVAMAYNFPAVIHRLESTLIAREASAILGLQQIRPELALEALTKDCDNTGEELHGNAAAPINFQAGMGRNYERLELLGDSFLKMATTIAVFTLIPDKDEFEYHVERMILICNKNLFNHATKLGLEQYIRSKAFDRRTWYPSAYDSRGAVGELATPTEPPAQGLRLTRGKKSNTNHRHILGDKSIADVSEAMIGAAYLTTYSPTLEPGHFDLAVRAVTATVVNKNHKMTCYADYYKAYNPPDWQTATSTPQQLDLAEQIATKMGYRFKHPRLLRSAFMHPSYPRQYELLPSYQRLEFLGDALFDMAAVNFLFHAYPGKDPQWLTEHKMAMVSNQFLGALGVQLGFHRHIVAFSGAVQRGVTEWVAEISEAREAAEVEAEQAGKGRGAFARDYWVHVASPPKCIPDVLEAYIGAIFVDSEYDYGVVDAFFNTYVKPFFEDMSVFDTFANKHPVTFAVNILTNVFCCREWRVVVQETDSDEGVPGQPRGGMGGPVVVAGFMVHGKVIGHGTAVSGRYAKISAAKMALKRLESMSGKEFAELTGCACQGVGEGKERVVVDEEKERGTPI